MSIQAKKADAFVRLHESDHLFMIPNPWDVGSARVMENQGFRSLATTSSGFAQTLGRQDGQVTADEMLQHCVTLCAATAVPISADLENCYADDPEEAAKSLLRFAETGIVGASIEDYTPGPEARIYDFEHAVERVHAAVDAVSKLPYKFTLTARAENLLRGIDDIDDTIKRLQAFEAVGADVLYAPALKTMDEIRLVASSVSRPINVLGSFLRDHTIEDIGAAGATRVSTGGSLARLMLGTLLSATNEMRSNGGMGWISNCAGIKDVEAALANN